MVLISLGKCVSNVIAVRTDHNKQRIFVGQAVFRWQRRLAKSGATLVLVVVFGISVAVKMDMYADV